MSFERILVIDDELIIRRSVSAHFRKKGYQVAAADCLEEARELLARESFELILLDERLPDGKGSELLEELLQEPAAGRFIVMMSAHATLDGAIACMRMGAFDYLLKPFSLKQIEVALQRAESYDKLIKVNAHLSGELNKGSELVGNCAALRQLKQLICKVAVTEATVLITGENGTGKERVAAELYRLSRLASKPFIRVNCAAMSESLIESEFFGHEKGAFTGATQRRLGRFELADGGTILLDEIGEISPRIQAKLLRVLQEKEFERVGGTKTIQVKVRVVATTNRDLLAAVREGSFREDLYYRLSVFPVHVPPLRERADDILLLAQRFIKDFSAKHGTRVRGLHPAAERLLSGYAWPGNVRELQNAVERAVILAEPDTPLGPELFGQIVRHPTPVEHEQPAAEPLDEGAAVLAESAVPPICNSATRRAEAAWSSAPEAQAVAGVAVAERDEDPLSSLEDLEREHILRVLMHTSGNRQDAAAILSITTRTLRNKVHQYVNEGFTIPG